MLFDLRSGGRRRTVKVVYLGLALLMFVGFVGFGIGSSGLWGGIGDAITGNGSDGGGDERRRRAPDHPGPDRRPPRPRAPRPTRPPGPPSRRPASASPPSATTSTPRPATYTAEGRRQLTAAGTAWDKYVALDPPTPDERLARQMAQAFLSLEQPGQGRRRPGGRDPDRARPSRPSRTWRILAYQAGQLRKGDLAAAKAVDLAPKDEQKDLKTQLDAGQGPGRSPSRSRRPRRPRRPTVG